MAIGPLVLDWAVPAFGRFDKNIKNRSHFDEIGWNLMICPETSWLQNHNFQCSKWNSLFQPEQMPDFQKKKSSEHVLKPRPSSTMFNHQLLNSCKFFQLSKVLVTQASVLTFKYQCDVVYSTFKKPKSGIWLLELFSRFWEGLFKAYFINSRSIIYRLNGEIRFQFIKVKNLFLFISEKWHVDRWLMYGKSKKYLN